MPRRSGTRRPWRKLYDRKESSSCSLLSAGNHRMVPGWPVMMRIGFGHDDLHFAHGDHGQEPNEHEEQTGKDSQGADERPNIDPSRVEQAPRRWQEVAVQPANDDDESLVPHARVNAHADEVDDVNVSPAP